MLSSVLGMNRRGIFICAGDKFRPCGLGRPLRLLGEIGSEGLFQNAAVRGKLFIPEVQETQ